jgi:hypothetical protein
MNTGRRIFCRGRPPRRRSPHPLARSRSHRHTRKVGRPCQRLWDSPSAPAVQQDFWTSAYQAIED